MHAAVLMFNALVENGTFTKGTKEYKVALRTIQILKGKIIKDGMRLNYSNDSQLQLQQKSYLLNKVH